MSKRHKLYYCLKESLQAREEWICNVLVYFKEKQIARKANIMLFKNKPLTYLFVNFINLPSNSLRFLRNFKKLIVDKASDNSHFGNETQKNFATYMQNLEPQIKCS